MSYDKLSFSWDSLIWGFVHEPCPKGWYLSIHSQGSVVTIIILRDSIDQYYPEDSDVPENITRIRVVVLNLIPPFREEENEQFL